MSDSIPSEQQGPEYLLVRLKEAQRKSGFVSREIMAELAESLNMPVSDVYGVASFYSFIYTQPMGRNVIRVCKSLSCDLKNSQAVIKGVAKGIGVKPGETTPDGRFSFELTNCLGLCDGAPAMMINDDAHIDLTPDKIAEILTAYK